MTKQQYLLGCDIGTGSSKGALTTLDGTVVALSEQIHHLSLPRPGWAEMDAEGVWWADFLAICADLVPHAEGGTIAAVGVSGIGPCIVPADSAGQPLRPAILYGIDTRSTAETAEIMERYGEDRITAVGGNPMNAQSIGGRMLWLQRNEPQVWERTRYWFMASSYLGYRLTGAYVLDHVSASYSEPLYDVANGRWVEEWCTDLAPELRMPELVWPAQAIGGVTPTAALQTGLPVGVPVVAGTIDAFADAMSVGVRHPGEAVLIYGSTMTVVQVTDTFRPCRPLWVNAHLFPGTYNQAAGTATSGSLTKWLRDLIGTDADFGSLTTAARAVPPGSNGLVALPYFAGERSPLLDPDARGVLLGLTLDHGRGHLYRALLEATAYGVAHILEAMRETGTSAQRAFAVGGGITGGLWPQIVSDVTGLTQEITEQSVGACYGDAMLAGVGAGLIAEDADWATRTGVVEPNPAAQEAYQPYYRTFRELHRATAGLQHRMADLQRRGPG
ncbi:MAG: FGGY-family carbohydrate kinase [Micropruina sp.]|uniref:FGGY-family carbohydrate kinase n=1 Tax=Micropruina sp. TaxID=2737536 RepID=UPI0039E692ED